jgi:hypothetical protein
MGNQEELGRARRNQEVEELGGARRSQEALLGVPGCFAGYS